MRELLDEIERSGREIRKSRRLMILGNDIYNTNQIAALEAETGVCPPGAVAGGRGEAVVLIGKTGFALRRNGQLPLHHSARRFIQRHAARLDAFTPREAEGRGIAGHLDPEQRRLELRAAQNRSTLHELGNCGRGHERRANKASKEKPAHRQLRIPRRIVMARRQN